MSRIPESDMRSRINFWNIGPDVKNPAEENLVFGEFEFQNSLSDRALISGISLGLRKKLEELPGKT